MPFAAFSASPDSRAFFRACAYPRVHCALKARRGPAVTFAELGVALQSRRAQTMNADPIKGALPGQEFCERDVVLADCLWKTKPPVTYGMNDGGLPAGIPSARHLAAVVRQDQGWRRSSR